jgi:hypothetical protein
MAAGGDNPWSELARAVAVSGSWDAALGYLESDAARSSGIVLPLVALGDIAAEIRDNQRAVEYFNRATEAYPDQALPWLRLCDIGLSSKNFVLAKRYLDEAEARGADPAEIAARDEQIESKAGTTDTITTTIR